MSNFNDDLTPAEPVEDLFGDLEVSWLRESDLVDNFAEAPAPSDAPVAEIEPAPEPVAALEPGPEKPPIPAPPVAEPEPEHEPIPLEAVAPEPVAEPIVPEPVTAAMTAAAPIAAEPEPTPAAAFEPQPQPEPVYEAPEAVAESVETWEPPAAYAESGTTTR